MPNGRAIGPLSRSSKAGTNVRLSHLIAGLTVMLCCGAVHAHEIGTTRVSATFQEGRTYDVEIVTDATALAEKLEVSPGSGFEEKFRQRVKVVFDAAEVRPQISYSVEPPIDALSAAAATIHLTGQIPDKAQHFTWTFGWTFATYSLTAGGATQWLE